MQAAPAAERVRLRRKPDRGSYDFDVAARILDEGIVCHVGFIRQGEPCVLPCNYARVDRHLYLHGSPASALFLALAAGASVCVSVTLLDGIVLGRSGGGHSLQYRSVVVFGRSEEVKDPDEKRRALAGIVDQIVPGRSAEVRMPDAAELGHTCVVRVPIVEFSAKINEGAVNDPPEDVALPAWAGVIPYGLRAGAPVPDPALPSEAVCPDAIAHYDRRPKG